MSQSTNQQDSNGKPQTAAAQSRSPGKTPEAAKSGSENSSVEMLKQDHRAVEQLFKKFCSADDGDKPDLIARICKALTIHTILEEVIFYPACKEKLGETAKLDEAQVEHDSLKLLIAELQGNSRSTFRDAQVTVLCEQVKHHVAEEEKAGDGILALAQAKGVDTPALAEQMRRYRDDLETERVLHAAPLRSYKTLSNYRSPQEVKENEMPRTQQMTPDRDQYGRFLSDDDRGGRYGRSMGRDRDDEGRYGSRRSSSRDDYDDRRSSRGSGWYGDQEGHAEAARRGWDHREDGGRSSRYDHDDDRGGRSYRSGSSSYDDDDRGGRSQRSAPYDDRGRGHGGWSGDPEGHSEASRRGWDHREGGFYRSSHDYDDDDRRGRSRMSRNDDDDRRHGRGGWFGDSEGHSAAARRGWDDRH